MAAKNPFDAFHTSLEDYFTSSKYYDLIIRCDTREFKVHRIVVCGQSQYFSKACDGDWKEAANGTIELKEDNARAVEAMLHFMYTFDYDGSGNDLERISPMLFNIEVYSAAEKYDIPALKLRAKEKFEKAVETCWDMDDFAHAITDIYSSTPPTDRGLRDKVVEVAYQHISALLMKHTFRNVLEETVGFAADVTQLMASSEGPLHKYRCPSCDKKWEALIPSTGAYCCMHCGYRQSSWANSTVK